MLRIFCDDGSEGTGYSYTIGNGGSSVIALLRDHLAPRLLGKDPDMVEEIWKDLFFHTHATSVGAHHQHCAVRGRYRAVGPALPGGGAAVARAWRAVRSAASRCTTPRAAGCI